MVFIRLFLTLWLLYPEVNTFTWDSSSDKTLISVVEGYDESFPFGFELSDGERIKEITWSFKQLYGSFETIITKENKLVILPEYSSRVNVSDNGVFALTNTSHTDSGVYKIEVQVRNENGYINKHTKWYTLFVKECEPGRYGQSCDQSCSKECFADKCNSVTGVCTKGCKSGWMKGSNGVCDAACQHGTYGQDCKYSCSEGCKNVGCNSVSGSCNNGCDPGYLSDSSGRCELKCPTLSYGQDCQNQCSIGCKNRTCHHVSGSCLDGCLHGWVPGSNQHCSSQCTDGWYGQDCKQRCSSKCYNDKCDSVSGRCTEGCKPGYFYGSDQSCNTGAYARLIGGSSPRSGRVEVFYQGVWGTVCDDAFGHEDAVVVCRMLGYPSTSPTFHSATQFGAGSGSIWLDELACNGEEFSVNYCGSNSWGQNDCGHHEDVGVVC